MRLYYICKRITLVIIAISLFSFILPYSFWQNRVFSNTYDFVGGIMGSIVIVCIVLSNWSFYKDDNHTKFKPVLSDRVFSFFSIFVVLNLILEIVSVLFPNLNI